MTGRPSESDRLRRCEPAFGQLNCPMEPTSEPQWHDQTPMLIRMNCDPHAMPQGRPMAGRHRAGHGRNGSLTLGSPSRSPGLARGALERLLEVTRDHERPEKVRHVPKCARCHRSVLELTTSPSLSKAFHEDRPVRAADVISILGPNAVFS
jgi:hypothetical protein